MSTAPEHDPILAIDLAAIAAAAEKVAAARAAVDAAEAERDELIAAAHAAAGYGDVARIAAAAGVSTTRVLKIATQHR